MQSIKNVWRGSSQTKTPTSNFHIGESLRFTNSVHIKMLDLVYIKTNDTDSTKYIIELFRGNTMILTNEFLKSENFQILDIFQFPQRII